MNYRDVVNVGRSLDVLLRDSSTELLDGGLPHDKLDTLREALQIVLDIEAALNAEPEY